MSVCCECCVLLGRGLCDELITGPEELYRMLCIVVCDLEPSWMGRPWPKKKTDIINTFCQLTNSMGHSFPWGAHNCLIPQESLPHFMEFEGPWPCLQEPDMYPILSRMSPKAAYLFLVPSKWLGVSAMFLSGSRKLGMRFLSFQSIPKAHYIGRHLISYSFCFPSVSSCCFLRPRRYFSQHSEIKDLQSGLKGVFLA